MYNKYNDRELDESDSLLLCLEGDVMRGSKIAKEIEDDFKREKAIRRMLERKKLMEEWRKRQVGDRDEKAIGETEEIH